MFLKVIKPCFAGVLLCAGITLGQLPFSDDFSQGGANTNWVKSSDDVVMKFESGGCSLKNNAPQSVGFSMHSFANKPSTFTLAGKVTLSDGSGQMAGFICCLAESGMATGYYVSIQDNELVVVNKMGSSGLSDSVFSKSTAFLTDGTNELKISRNDSGKFNVFCNGAYIGTFTDNTLSPGNIALFAAPQVTAVFDDIVMTNTFTDGAEATCFADDFNDGDLTGWDHFGSSSVVVENVDSTMQITTAADEQAFRVIDMALNDLVLRVVLSHRKGSNNEWYGLFLSGDGETIPIAHFGINGARNFAVFLPNVTFTPAPSSKVKGTAYIDGTDTVYYKDTLEVIKRSGSQEYLFIVNTDTLSRFTGITFPITGAGVFCLDSMVVRCDDFMVAKGDGSGCMLGIIAVRPGRTLPVLPTIGGTSFDLLGRVVSQNRTISAISRAPGLYIVRNSDAKRSIRIGHH